MPPSSSMCNLGVFAPRWEGRLVALILMVSQDTYWPFCLDHLKQLC